MSSIQSKASKNAPTRSQKSQRTHSEKSFGGSVRSGANPNYNKGASSTRNLNASYSSLSTEMEKEYQKMKIIMNKKTPIQKKPNLNRGTEKIILQKFNTKFTNTLMNILKVNDNKLPTHIGREVYLELMRQMECVTSYRDLISWISEYSSTECQMPPSSNKSHFSPESQLLIEMWSNLVKITENKDNSANHKNAQKIPVGDLKLFLMAIFNVKGNKRMNINPPEQVNADLTSNEQQNLTYGWLNENNQLCLKQSDIQKIQIRFQSFNLNILNTKEQQYLERKDTRSDINKINQLAQNQPYSFMPNVSASRGSLKKGSSNPKIKTQTNLPGKTFSNDYKKIIEENQKVIDKYRKQNQQTSQKSVQYKFNSELANSQSQKVLPKRPAAQKQSSEITNIQSFQKQISLIKKQYEEQIRKIHEESRKHQLEDAAEIQKRNKGSTSRKREAREKSNTFKFHETCFSHNPECTFKPKVMPNTTKHGAGKERNVYSNDSRNRWTFEPQPVLTQVPKAPPLPFAFANSRDSAKAQNSKEGTRQKSAARDREKSQNRNSSTPTSGRAVQKQILGPKKSSTRELFRAKISASQDKMTIGEALQKINDITKKLDPVQKMKVRRPSQFNRPKKREPVLMDMRLRPSQNVTEEVTQLKYPDLQNAASPVKNMPTMDGDQENSQSSKRIRINVEDLSQPQPFLSQTQRLYADDAQTRQQSRGRSTFNEGTKIAPPLKPSNNAALSRTSPGGSSQPSRTPNRTRGNQAFRLYGINRSGSSGSPLKPLLSGRRKRQRRPLLYIDVEVPLEMMIQQQEFAENKYHLDEKIAEKERITVYQGDDPKLLSQEFCTRFKLNDDKIEMLATQISNKIEQIKQAQNNRDGAESDQYNLTRMNKTMVQRLNQDLRLVTPTPEPISKPPVRMTNDTEVELMQGSPPRSEEKDGLDQANTDEYLKNMHQKAFELQKQQFEQQRQQLRSLVDLGVSDLGFAEQEDEQQEEQIAESKEDQIPRNIHSIEITQNDLNPVDDNKRECKEERKQETQELKENDSDLNERLIPSNDELEEFRIVDKFLSNELSYGELPDHQRDGLRDHRPLLVSNDGVAALEEQLHPTAEPGRPKKSGTPPGIGRKIVSNNEDQIELALKERMGESGQIQGVVENAQHQQDSPQIFQLRFKKAQ